MAAVITRKALVHHGHAVPDDLALVIHDHRGRRVVTWADVLRDRRERQAWILANKRRVEPWRAVRLLVAYFDQELFGGWQAFVDDLHDQVWIDRDAPGLKRACMELFPAPDLFADWETWKPWFARAHRRRTQDRRPVGVAFLWRRGDELKVPAGRG